MTDIPTLISYLQRYCPDRMLYIPTLHQSDLSLILDALKHKNTNYAYYAMLKILQSYWNRHFKPNKIIYPLMEIKTNDLFGDFATVTQHNIKETRLRICEAIIEAEETSQAVIVYNHLSKIIKEYLTDPMWKARVELARAGSYFLKSDYLNTAQTYLSASRYPAFLKDPLNKLALIDKAIAFVFVAPISHISHKLICMLCLNYFTKNSQYMPILSKLYTGDILNNDYVTQLYHPLPNNLKQKDKYGISQISQSKFSHNMIPIINSFYSISFRSLIYLIGIPYNYLMILLERTYQNGYVMIDQINEFVYFKQIEEYNTIKEFLNKLDMLIEQNIGYVGQLSSIRKNESVS